MRRAAVIVAAVIVNCTAFVPSPAHGFEPSGIIIAGSFLGLFHHHSTQPQQGRCAGELHGDRRTIAAQRARIAELERERAAQHARIVALERTLANETKQTGAGTLTRPRPIVVAQAPSRPARQPRPESYGWGSI